MTSSLPTGRTMSNAPAPKTASEAARRHLESPVPRVPPTLAEQRAVCDRVQRELGARQIERYGVEMRDAEIAGVPVRIFIPPSEADASRVLLNLHGGGFTKDAGSVTENVPIAALARTRVVAVRYRLAPEFPFPAAVEDSLAVYRELLKQYAARRIGLYGTSAGAILCSQVIVRLQQLNLTLPSRLGFFSGSADLLRAGDTEHFFRPADDDSTAQGFFASYIDGRDPAAAELSPLFGDLGGFPPTLCIAGTRDFLLSQTALFHRALLQAEVEARLVVFEAMPHAHWIYLDLPESDEAFAHMSDFLSRNL